MLYPTGGVRKLHDALGVPLDVFYAQRVKGYIAENEGLVGARTYSMFTRWLCGEGVVKSSYALSRMVTLVNINPTLWQQGSFICKAL